MRKILVGIVGVHFLVLGSPLNAGTIELPKYGFRMEALEASLGTSPVATIITFLPPSDGFSPNINVVIQPFKGSIDDYIEISKKQFEEEKDTIVSEHKVANREWTVEYHGVSDGRHLHFYARSIVAGTRVYLVTATATELQWKSVGNKLKACTESFQLDKKS